MDKQWIFIDESGKPEVFSSNGINLVETKQASRYLILSAIRTSNQLDLQQGVTKFRLDLMKNKKINNIFSSSYTLDSLHAQIDYPEVKILFYEFINSLDVKIDVLVVEKLKTFDALRMNSGKMYGVMSGQLIKDLCHQFQNTEIVFSRKDSKLKLRQELQTEVERVRLEYLEKHPKITPNLQLSYYHNPHYTHGGLQVADYVSFAIFQVFENNKREYYEIIKSKIGRIQDICNKKYYTQSNPL
jgi:hypothetical protein